MQATPGYHQVIIIGTGFGGQCAAIRLQKMGIDDVLMLERRDFFGGTWCQNRYPGAAVDVQSPLYSLSSEPFDWSQMFAEQEELEAYTRHVISKNDLESRIQLNTNVTQVGWDESTKRWQIETENQGKFEAQFLINASGPLSTPVIPDFKGKDSFQGKSFHTNDWDRSYDYRNKRVAVVGSGASAAQVIPAIAADVKSLHVFQRTPHWVLPRPDYVFRPWQRALLKNSVVYKLLRFLIYMFLEFRVIGLKYSDVMLNLLGTRKALRLIKEQIADPDLRKKVTPDYKIGCKRVLLSNAIYPALCRSNVELHCRDDGIREITDTGIITSNGTEIDLDLIVYSTGYDATDGVISYPVIGKGGQILSDVWKEFPRAYLGTMIPAFPNLFIVGGPNTGIGHTSAIFGIESQMSYITSTIDAVIQQGKQVVEVNDQVESAYTNWVHEELDDTVWTTGGCNSWYKSKSGHVIAIFPGFSFTFRRWAAKFRNSDHVLT